MGEKMEDLINCVSCDQAWWIETHKKGFVKNLSMLCGYTCPECAGDPPERWADNTKTLFPARKANV
jgi:ferredoxin